jgi:chromosome segregation ATPase
MKFVRTFVAMPLLVCILVSGCGGARYEVAKDNAIRKLDELLGAMAVKRKEIDLSLRGLNEMVAGLKRAKLKAQANADELSRKAEPSEVRLREIDETLARYRDLLAKNESVTLGGKSYSPEDLRSNADKLIQGRKATAAAVATFQKSKNELQKVVDGLTDKQRSVQSKIDSMKLALGQIDSQMVAVKAIQEAKASTGDPDVTLTSAVTNLEQEIVTLGGEIDLILGDETTGFDEDSTNNELAKLDALVRATGTPADTVADIDAIIGASK